MDQFSPSNPLELLYAALHSPAGIAVNYEGEYRQAINILEGARIAAKDPALYELIIGPSSLGQQQLWIIKRNAETPEQPA